MNGSRARPVAAGTRLLPLILISNDDGIRAPGLIALAGRLAEVGDVVVSAPDRQRSATSHAISLDHPLRAEEVSPGWFAVDGTPADCVYLGLHHLVPRRPSLVVSGINDGVNLGSDFFYSGTVAAAVEGAIRGLPAFAISLAGGPESGLGHAADFAYGLACAILRDGLPANVVLNVNVPNRGRPHGFRWTRLGARAYRDQVEARSDLRGRRYFWIGGPEVAVAGDVDADGTAVRADVISVTPLDLDLTSDAMLASRPAWQIPGFERIPAGEPDGGGG